MLGAAIESRVGWRQEKLAGLVVNPFFSSLSCKLNRVPESMSFDVIELLDLLKNLGFHISVRCRALRVSISVFNTMVKYLSRLWWIDVVVSDA